MAFSLTISSFPTTMYKQMDYFCDVYDKTIEIKSKSKYLKSLTHEKFENQLRIKHTIQNPNFFDMDEVFNENITNYNKKIRIISC